VFVSWLHNVSVAAPTTIIASTPPPRPAGLASVSVMSTASNTDIHPAAFGADPSGRTDSTAAFAKAMAVSIVVQHELPVLQDGDAVATLHRLLKRACFVSSLDSQFSARPVLSALTSRTNVAPGP